MTASEAMGQKHKSNHVKSKARVSDHGEVFTNEREVNAMLDLVKQETERIDSRFLEPACGTGNFLIEVLKRKLNVVKSRYKKSQLEYEMYSIIALSSIYGIDLLQDNINECRDRLFEIYSEYYQNLFNSTFKDECLDSAKYILSKNIVQGDALTLKTVGNTKDPIVFAEWAAVTGRLIKRRDFAFENLMEKKNKENRTLFSQPPIEGQHLTSDLGDRAFIPRPVQDYPLTHYLKLAEHA